MHTYKANRIKHVDAQMSTFLICSKKKTKQNKTRQAASTIAPLPPQEGVKERILCPSSTHPKAHPHLNPTTNTIQTAYNNTKITAKMNNHVKILLTIIIIIIK